MTALDELIGEIDVLSPQRPEIWERDVEPWLGSAIEMDYPEALGLSQSGVLLVSQAQHVPKWVYGLHMPVKRYQPGR